MTGGRFDAPFIPGWAEYRARHPAPHRDDDHPLARAVDATVAADATHTHADAS
jgi:hypothetical protein